MLDKRAILHVPHTEMFALKPIDAWVKTFSEDRFSRTVPTEVVLPGVGLGGPSFQSEVHPYPAYLEPPKDAGGKYTRPFNLLPDWIQQCRATKQDMVIWAFMNPVYAFLAGDHTRVVDQHGITLDNNMCIANQLIQRMTDVFIDEIAAMGVDGFVFDLTDIYPQSGSNMLAKGTQNTCFCPFCLDALESEGFHEGAELFVGATNPFRLVLRVDSDGIAHIPIDLDWPAAHLVKMSIARGFVTDGDEKLQQDAETLMSYVRARSRVVAQAIRRLGQRAREQQKRVAVILGDAQLDLTTMGEMKTIQRYEAADEFWAPQVDRKYVLQQKVNVCAYLWARGTYSVNAFFETFEQADTILALQGVNVFLERLLARSKRLLGNSLTPGNVFSVKMADEFQGFVGIPLGQTDHAELVNILSKRATGQILPPEVLEAFRITNPGG
ncbi:MAG: hypothetical protein IT318_01270 [Anaerolineales bacterium]|nr:hypothetical protein [Anaerolineales bacterium]